MAKSALIDDLEKQFAENPRRVFARLANEYRKAGELETAIEICRAHVPLQPTYISGYIVLGQALFESGQLAEARSTFETALGLDPENLIALRQLGDIARAGGDAAGARGWYRRLLEVDPQNDEVVALVDELAAAAEEPAAGAAPPAAAPITWGDINPEQSAAAAPSAAEAPRASVEPPAAPEPPAPSAAAPQAPAPGTAPPEPALETLDLTDLQFVGMEPPAAVQEPESPREAAPPATEGFDFESLSSFGIDSFSTGHAHVSGIERADELFSPDADNAGQPIPGLEIEGLERGGYLAEATPTPSVPDAGATSRPSPFDDAAAGAGTGSTDEAGIFAQAGEPATGAIPELPVEELSVESILMGEPAVEPAIEPGVEPAAEAAPPAFVTETMAELYLRQGHRDAALEIYRQLVAQRPTDAALRERLAQLEQPEKQGAPERTVRAFFARLALKQPPSASMPPAAAAPAAEPVAAEAARATAPGVGERGAPEVGERTAPEVAAPRAGEPELERAVFLPAEAARLERAVEPAAEEAAPLPFDLSALERPAPEASVPEIVAPESPEAEPPVREPRTEQQPVAELLFGEPEPTPAAEVPPAARQIPSDVVPAAEAAGATAADVDVESLFASEAVSADDEMAAATLAGAFAPEMAPAASAGSVGGHPARAASDPLSLDTVFREGRGGAERRPQPSVSFDEFFAGEEGEPSQPGAGDEAQPAADSNPDRDLELFQAWLEGLKK